MKFEGHMDNSLIRLGDFGCFDIKLNILTFDKNLQRKSIFMFSYPYEKKGLDILISFNNSYPVDDTTFVNVSKESILLGFYLQIGDFAMIQSDSARDILDQTDKLFAYWSGVNYDKVKIMISRTPPIHEDEFRKKYWNL